MWSFFIRLLIEKTETLCDSTISFALLLRLQCVPLLLSSFATPHNKNRHFSVVNHTHSTKKAWRSKIAANCRFWHENVTWMRNHASNGPPIDDDDTLMALFVFKLWCEYGVSHSFNCNALYMATDWPVPDRLNSTKMAIDWLPLFCFFNFRFASHSIWPIISHAFSLRVDPARPPNEKWIYLRCA